MRVTLRDQMKNELQKKKREKQQQTCQYYVQKACTCSATMLLLFFFSLLFLLLFLSVSVYSFLPATLDQIHFKSLVIARKCYKFSKYFSYSCIYMFAGMFEQCDFRSFQCSRHRKSSHRFGSVHAVPLIMQFSLTQNIEESYYNHSTRSTPAKNQEEKKSVHTDTQIHRAHRMRIDLFAPNESNMMKRNEHNE